MNYIEVEARESKCNFNMANMQSHDYYELYFLLEGKREIFFENRMYLMSANSFCVIPPFCIHKTTGGAYKRINIYISKKLLSKEENKFLENCYKDFAFALTHSQMTFILSILDTAIKLNNKLKQEYLLSHIKVIIAYLRSQQFSIIEYSSTINSNNNDPLILEILAYINHNYNKILKLEFFSKKYFISLNTLCKRFKKSTNTSIQQYILLVRFNHAKMYLLQTNKSIEKISNNCGFSSANYFSLMFKKHFGISPSAYRKKN